MLPFMHVDYNAPPDKCNILQYSHGATTTFLLINTVAMSISFFLFFETLTHL